MDLFTKNNQICFISKKISVACDRATEWRFTISRDGD